MTTKTVPQILREAADHIEKVGLGKGDFFTPMVPGETPLGERPCCTMGAIGLETGYYFQDPQRPSQWDVISLYDYEDDAAMIALGNARTPEDEAAAMRPESRPIARLLEDTRLYLAGYLGEHGHTKHVPTWNDDDERTAEDVISTLRAAADAYVVEGV